jgi:hypothetical protein
VKSLAETILLIFRVCIQSCGYRNGSACPAVTVPEARSDARPPMKLALPEVLKESQVKVSGLQLFACGTARTFFRR